MSNEMGAPVRMQCVDRKPKRRGRPPKRLPDEVGEQLAGLLPDEALQDASRDAEQAFRSRSSDRRARPRHRPLQRRQAVLRRTPEFRSR